MTKHWRVEVYADGEQLIAIEPEMLAGKSELTEDNLDTIRHCAEHLRGFAGSGEPTPCFYCGGSGEIETDNNGPIGVCPICSPNAKLSRRGTADAESKTAAKLRSA